MHWLHVVRTHVITATLPFVHKTALSILVTLLLLHSFSLIITQYNNCFIFTFDVKYVGDRRLKVWNIEVRKYNAPQMICNLYRTIIFFTLIYCFKKISTTIIGCLFVTSYQLFLFKIVFYQLGSIKVHVSIRLSIHWVRSWGVWLIIKLWLT